MISSLSDFLRLTLGTSNAPESALRSEVEFARRYLDIERARFGERLTVEEDLPGDTLACLVPTLILQPLLENAIRHGIERSESRGTIWISARRDAGHLVLRVADSGPGLQASNGARKGIGLANTRARIRELHGDAGDLRLSERAGGGLEVEIRLPWKVPAA
jgi:two-component system, LytTR family, sensor kinase